MKGILSLQLHLSVYPPVMKRTSWMIPNGDPSLGLSIVIRWKKENTQNTRRRVERFSKIAGG
jgi:hypothetical protein